MSATCRVATLARTAVREAVNSLDPAQLECALRSYGWDPDAGYADARRWLTVEIEVRAVGAAEDEYPRNGLRENPVPESQEWVLANQYVWAQSMLSQAHDLPIAAACVLVCRAGVLLVICDEQGRPLGFPGGKREPGETPVACAARELLKESGVRVAERDLREVYVGPAGDRVCAGFVVDLPRSTIALRPEPGRTLRWIVPEDIAAADSMRFVAWDRAALAALQSLDVTPRRLP